MDSKRKICVPLINRANYTSIKTVMEALRDNSSVELQVVLGASAVIPRYGDLIETVKADGFDVKAVFSSHVEGSTLSTMSKTTGYSIVEFTTILENLNPEIVVVIGDRFEAMSIALSSFLMNKIVAHTMGGEVTGTADESLRHAITKLSHIHFPANEDSKIRIEKLGEISSNIFNFGCPRNDLVLRIMQDSEINFDIFEKYGGVGATFQIDEPFLLVLQHPVTTEFDNTRFQIKKTLDALLQLRMNTIMIWPNPDAGSEFLSKEIRTFREKFDTNNFLHLFTNLPPEIFTKLMCKCACMVGNSSSAIRDGEALGVPAVNIGTRQQGRVRGRNVIDVDYSTKQIVKAVNNQIKKGHYSSEHIYGNGYAGQKIADILCSIEIKDIQKKITY